MKTQFTGPTKQGLERLHTETAGPVQASFSDLFTALPGFSL